MVNNENSGMLEITYGVPQGSVLGPILYLLYINDIKLLAETIELRLFADDTNLFVSEGNLFDLESKANNALKICHDWLLCNKLTLNVKKTHCLLFTNLIENDDRIIQIKIGENKIELKKSTKYLGLHLQADLKWQTHINYILNKLNRYIPLFYNIRGYLNKFQKLVIYNALIFPVINYAIELYGCSATTFLKQIQITQNRLLKILFRKPFRYSTNSLHSENKILKIQDNYNLRLALLIHKLFYFPNMVPEEFNGCLVRTNSVHSYPSRRPNNIYLTTNDYKTLSTINAQASIVWNNLPVNEKSISNRNAFKDIICNRILSSYRD